MFINHISYELDVYSFFLKNLEYKTTDKAFLAYYYPDECDLHKGLPFNCTIIEVRTYASPVKDLVKKAFDVLNNDLPDSNENCKYCKWN